MTTVAALSLFPNLVFRPSYKFCSKRVGGKNGFKVLAVFSEEASGLERKSNSSVWGALFDVEDPGPRQLPVVSGKILDVNQALEVARLDLQYCDWRARQDLLTIMLLHNKVVEVLNPLAREFKSIGTMKKELAELQQELAQAHQQVHLSEARVGTALDKLAYMEALVHDKLLPEQKSKRPSRPTSEPESETYSPTTSSSNSSQLQTKSQRRNLNVSGPVKPYNPCLKNFWYPVAFSSDVKDDTMIPIDFFEQPWVIFRGKDGQPGCVQNTCAHRACPLHLGSINEGRIQCPYHGYGISFGTFELYQYKNLMAMSGIKVGTVILVTFVTRGRLDNPQKKREKSPYSLGYIGWEYSTDGKCEKMPSTKKLNVKIKALPCFEQEGMIWVWPGTDPPKATIPSLLPPPGFQIHAEIVIELPVEHGLLLDNLLDLAHAPFTHTSTFAKGWPVPSLVKFLTPASGLEGYWDPYPIDMEFRPPCMVLSTIGISKPGKLEGKSTKECTTHLHQLHVCLPSSRQKTRLLYRMSLDFAPWLKHVPMMHLLWRYFAEQVLNEDLRLVLGQQERMINGENVWNLPVSYDKLGVRYRLWRDAVDKGADRLPFTKQINSGLWS